jgi:dienelactone hydrolase
MPLIVNQDTQLVLGLSESTSAEAFFDLLSSPCLSDNIQDVPTGYVSEISCPLLALYGEKDVHVPAEEHSAALEAILRESGNRQYKIRTIPDANHLFQDCETGFPSEYATIDHSISGNVIEVIAAWIRETMRR